MEKTQFHISELLHLLSSNNVDVRLKVGTALGTFGFNNTASQYAIRNAGGIPMTCFEEFLVSNDEIQRAHAAFQTVVLARVIEDSDPVSFLGIVSYPPNFIAFSTFGIFPTFLQPAFRQPITCFRCTFC